MEVIYIVLPLALFFAAVFVGAFVWAVRRGQLDDLETPAIRVALEDVETGEPKEKAEPKETVGTTGSTEIEKDSRDQEDMGSSDVGSFRKGIGVGPRRDVKS